MSKRKRKNRRQQALRRRRMLKIAAAVFLLVVAVTLLPMCGNDDNKETDQTVGVWVSYGDFKTLGLYNQDEEGFRENAGSFLDMMEEYGINTIYFHVRAFRDAAYDSQHFPMASYVWDRSETISYDPLKIMIQLAHERDMELHAWMNPYRNYDFDMDILDPADESTTEEILLCVGEVLDNYDVDGIHFDDYFYEEGNELPDSEKMENVNAMVKAVYERVHDAGRDLVFGISPAGNTAYCESIGADIGTWLSEDGYVDYVVPQIYWTDQHTAAWRDKMFSDTLDEWCGLNTNNTDMYIGLAAYKAGTDDEEDPGWENSSENLAFQVQQINEKDCGGYVFFSAGDFFRKAAEEELENYRNLVF